MGDLLNPSQYETSGSPMTTYQNNVDSHSTLKKKQPSEKFSTFDKKLEKVPENNDEVNMEALDSEHD